MTWLSHSATHYERRLWHFGVKACFTSKYLWVVPISRKILTPWPQQQISFQDTIKRRCPNKTKLFLSNSLIKGQTEPTKPLICVLSFKLQQILIILLHITVSVTQGESNKRLCKQGTMGLVLMMWVTRGASGSCSVRLT